MLKNPRGVTLTELMVSVVIISIGILGFFGAFSFITKSLYVSRTRTLATNLAQERIEVLKNLTYYELLITTSSSSDNNFTPSIAYDNTNYPPETISIGGINFTRYTYVSLAQIDSDVITQVAYTYPDTGMKQVTVNVIWDDRGSKKKWSLTNLLENPNVNPLDSSLSGTINKTTGGALPGAVVKAEENPDWSASADSSGNWSFRVYHGSYTIRASSAGYFDSVSARQSATTGSNTVVPTISLQPISSGTISGIVWLSTHIVISQVVVSSQQADALNFRAQYIELFNPTTGPVNIGGSPPSIKLNIRAPITCANDLNCSDATNGINLTYVSTYVAANHYYLIANTTTFTVNGSSAAADAYYSDTAVDDCAIAPNNTRWNLTTSPQKKMIFPVDHGATVWLTDSAGAIIDAMGTWHTGTTYNCENACPYVASPTGFPDNAQLVRFSSPAASAADLETYGDAYDSNNNLVDFAYRSPIDISPRNTSSSTKTVVSGTPAIGALIAASDTLSGSTQAYRATVSSGSMVHPYAAFSLPGVSTGTWSVVITSAGYFVQIDTVSVQSGAVTSIPSSSTVPSWPVSNNYSVRLTTPSVGAYVEGIVTNISAQPMSGIQVLAAGTPKVTGANGAYFAATSSGTISIVANPNNANPSYVAQLVTPTLATGEVYTQNFILSGGGALQGYLTTGTTPLPNYVVVARIGGSQYGSGVSNTTGSFYIRNLSTGTYTIAPALEVGQDSDPNTIGSTVLSGQTVFVGTFTVSGAFGYISGTVTNSGANVTSGALLLASASAIPASPTSIAGSSSAALTPIYAVSSKADGTYVLPVRGGSVYYLSVYVPTINANSTVTVTTKTYSGISVSPSVTTTQAVAIP